MADTSLETVWTGGWRFRTTNQLVFINFQGKLGHVCYIWEGKNTRVRVGNMQAASAGKNTFKIKMNTSCFHPLPTMLKFGGQANVREIDDCTVLYCTFGTTPGYPRAHLSGTGRRPKNRSIFHIRILRNRETAWQKRNSLIYNAQLVIGVPRPWGMPSIIAKLEASLTNGRHQRKPTRCLDGRGQHPRGDAKKPAVTVVVSTCPVGGKTKRNND